MLQKSLYSLMLMDDVVREIDRLALQQNTNRSNFINQWKDTFTKKSAEFNQYGMHSSQKMA